MLYNKIRIVVIIMKKFFKLTIILTLLTMCLINILEVNVVFAKKQYKDGNPTFTDSSSETSSTEGSEGISDISDPNDYNPYADGVEKIRK